MLDSPTVYTDRQTCFVIRHSHFDPTWRRCWDRDFFDSGKRFVSYRTLQTDWMDDMITSSVDPRNKFMVETTWTTRHYLERHPEQRETLARLLSEGRFEQLGAGENIIDTNLVHGELLARNMILGTLWTEKVLGARPVTGYYRDAFGTSAQLPQIFRQCGFRWIAHMDYNVPDAPYWRGLDGSTVLYLHPSLIPYAWACVPGAGSMHPCPVCKGSGCSDCEKRGYVVGRRSDFIYRPKEHWNSRAVIFLVGNEENLPGMHIGEDVERFNAEMTDFHAVQAVYHDLEPLIAGELAQLDNPPAVLLSSKVENNPCITGVYVSRIKVKQGHRQLEHTLLAAEAWDALLAGGAHAEMLRGIWRNLTFSGFHDAVTSTFCDDSYYELLDLHAAMRESIRLVDQETLTPLLTAQPEAVTIFNHQGFDATAPVTVNVPGAWEGAIVTCEGSVLPTYEVTAGNDETRVTFQSPQVPALSARTIQLAPARSHVQQLETDRVQCGRFSLCLGEHGITDVLAEGFGSVANTEDWFFGELVLEHDEGDPWSTRTLDRTRERMGQYTMLESVEQHGDSIAITYRGQHPSHGIFGLFDPMVLHLKWEQTFRLRAHCSWLEVETAIDWYTYNRRLRVAFPTVTRANSGVYEIPSGVLERERYDATSWDFIDPDGDWPAIHWAGIQTDAYLYAILNQGTPGYRIEDGAVMVSMLRSPASPGGILQPQMFVAHNHTSITDHGSHRFRHALYLGAGDWRTNDVMQQAALFNAGFTTRPGSLRAPLPAWSFDVQHTMLQAVKSAEDGNGIVLRLVEYAGQPETVRLRVPAAFRAASLTNLLEDNIEELALVDGKIDIPMAPNKIVTLRLRA